jgi:hypothetical protein
MLSPKKFSQRRQTFDTILTSEHYTFGIENLRSLPPTSRQRPTRASAVTPRKCADHAEVTCHSFPSQPQLPTISPANSGSTLGFRTHAQ